MIYDPESGDIIVAPEEHIAKAAESIVNLLAAHKMTIKDSQEACRWASEYLDQQAVMTVTVALNHKSVSAS